MVGIVFAGMVMMLVMLLLLLKQPFRPGNKVSLKGPDPHFVFHYVLCDFMGKILICVIFFQMK
jgi:hypothetical protein